MDNKEQNDSRPTGRRGGEHRSQSQGRQATDSIYTRDKGRQLQRAAQSADTDMTGQRAAKNPNAANLPTYSSSMTSSSFFAARLSHGRQQPEGGKEGKEWVKLGTRFGLSAEDEDTPSAPLLFFLFFFLCLCLSFFFHLFLYSLLGLSNSRSLLLSFSTFFSCCLFFRWRRSEDVACICSNRCCCISFLFFHPCLFSFVIPPPFCSQSTAHRRTLRQASARQRQRFALVTLSCRICSTT